MNILNPIKSFLKKYGIDVPNELIKKTYDKYKFIIDSEKYNDIKNLKELLNTEMRKLKEAYKYKNELQRETKKKLHDYEKKYLLYKVKLVKSYKEKLKKQGKLDNNAKAKLGRILQKIDEKREAKKKKFQKDIKNQDKIILNLERNINNLSKSLQNRNKEFNKKVLKISIVIILVLITIIIIVFKIRYNKIKKQKEQEEIEYAKQSADNIEI